jgi:hypothetical protein
MPSVLTMELPRPTDAIEFEKIVTEAMQLKWETPRLQRNGRPGQPQNGVDIWGEDDLGRSVAIQCKRTVAAPSISLIDEEISKAETFQPPFTTLYIATTADPDVHLQKRVRLLSSSRVAQSSFAVGMLFWEDIVSGLIRNSQVLKIIYPQLDLTSLAEQPDFRRASLALELGFHGGNMKGMAELILGELGQFSGEDPDQILIISSLIKTASQRLLPAEYADSIADAADQITAEVSAGMSGGQTKWSVISTGSERIRQRVDQACSLLSPLDEQALRVGYLLGAVYLMTEEPTMALLDRIEKETSLILTEQGRVEMRARLEPAREAVRAGNHAPFHWNERLRGLVSRDLRHRQLGLL